MQMSYSNVLCLELKLLSHFLSHRPYIQHAINYVRKSSAKIVTSLLFYHQVVNIATTLA